MVAKQGGSESARILGSGAEFEAHIQGFTARPSQQEMAQHIESTIERGGIFVAESGTGTGKTFAYLVPALLSRKKVIVSTGTRHLQDQLFLRDLPAVADALSLRPKSAILKGRSNYLCRERLESKALVAGASDSQIKAEASTVYQWSLETEDGDVAELDGIAEASFIWPLVTSTADNCAGSQCGHFEDCFVLQARRRAMDADIVVINHHIFFADLVLKNDGFGQLLPSFDAVIFDEAHQLADIATGFLGSSATSRQLLDLADDVINEERNNPSSVPDLGDGADGLRKALAVLRESMGRTATRKPMQEFETQPRFVESLLSLRRQLQTLIDLLLLAEPVSEEFGRCLDRAADLAERLETISGRDADDHVRWCEISNRGFRFQSSPIDTGLILGPHFDSSERSFIFTSATLAVGDSFEHFSRALGLPEFESARFDSPFDYRNRTLLFLPQGLPDPRSGDYTQAMLDVVVDVLSASRGRAFLLFTSYRALNAAAEYLPNHIDFPLLVQGSAARNALLMEFRNTESAILLGTSSFWEGVDVRGESLSVVVIDKLPFEAVDDPLVRGRLAYVESQGGNPFMEYQIPRAVMNLKQGAGRLIRDELDRGVLVLCDPRVKSKAYGRIFLKNLPPMPQSVDIGDVVRFFAQDSNDVADL